ncbi:MAG: hypothetical protein WA125_04590 [Desulfosporosinus sp.]
MNKTWHDEAWEDDLCWQTQDKKTLNMTLGSRAEPFGEKRKTFEDRLPEGVRQI